MDQRPRYAGRVFAGVYAAGVVLAILTAANAVERVLRLYWAGLPGSMISSGLGFGFPPSLLGWVLIAASVLLNGVIAYAWGAYFFERRAPASVKRAI